MRFQERQMEIIGTIAILMTIIGGCYGFWKKVISPKLAINKLRRFYALVEDWFDEIDRREISDLSMPLLNNKENKIRAFIEDNSLRQYRINFSQNFRKRFLEFCGIKKEVQDNKDLFERYSRCPINGIDVLTFWGLLIGAFYEFKNNYDQADSKTNFASVEMRVKLLKMYVEFKKK